MSVSLKPEGAVVENTGAGVVPDTVQEAAKKAVVFIDTRSRYGNGSGTLMTLPFLGSSRALLLTCNHVIPNPETAMNCAVSIDRYDGDKPGTTFTGEDLFDLSIFKTDTTNVPGWGKLLDFTIIGVKMDVLNRANIPGGPPSPLPMTDYQNMTSRPIVKDLITVVHYPKEPSGFQRCTNPERILKIADPMFGHSVTTYGGSSGCPIFREFQRRWIVVGLHRGELSDGTTVYTNLATHMSAVYDAYLDKPYTGTVPVMGVFAQDAKKMTKESTGEDNTGTAKNGSEGPTAEDVLEHFYERFVDEMDAETVVIGLVKADVIDKGDKRRIDKADNPTLQNQILHMCLTEKCTEDALMTVCDVIIAVKGNKKMKALGEAMKKRLEGQ